MSLSGKVLTFLLLFSLIELLASHAQSQEGGWKLIGKSKTDTGWYINTESLSIVSKNIVSVWVRSIPEKTGARDEKSEESAWSIMKDIQERNFGAYEYTEGLWELNCSKDMYRILYFVAYDRNGEIINSLLTPDAEWMFIMPGSVGETIQATLCE